MKSFLFGIVITAMAFVAYQLFASQKEEAETLEANAQLIQQQVKDVRKLIVSEGHFSNVFTYRATREVLGDYFTANKRALVVVNADVSIAFDLSKLTYNIDEENKTLTLTYIPEPEVNISPNLSYYDIQADMLNPFSAHDYNVINKKVRAQLQSQVNKSKLVTQSKDRLISELARFYVLVNSMGWKLVYNQNEVESLQQFDSVIAEQNLQPLIP